jgi:hypothetical protein
MKNSFAMMSLAGAMLAASSASAGSAGLGSVSYILPLSSGAGSSQLMFFNISSLPSGHPACATNTGRWVINVSTPAGQAMASLILTAYSLGKQITVQGTGACTDWPDTESVNYLVMP